MDLVNGDKTINIKQKYIIIFIKYSKYCCRILNLSMHLGHGKTMQLWKLA